MNYKKIIISLTATCIMLISPFSTSLAREQTVMTKIPNFTVSLNGNKVDSSKRQFPILVYKGITYFPMTWYDARLLGIETKWSNESGLEIEQKEITSDFNPYKSNKANQNIQYAKIIDSKIKINGKLVDNSKEKYPLLNFRDVTYFPLTWKFAHDEFNWLYNWSETTGLEIISNNKKMIDTNLPKYAGENGVAIYEGYFYFVETVGDKNNIYRLSKDNNSKRELIYSYNIGSTYGRHKNLSFDIRNDGLWFSYHHGGAVMGYDFYGKISKDGKVVEEHSGYLSFIETKYGTVMSRQGPMPSLGNLRLVPKGKNYYEGKSIGNDKLFYSHNMFLLSEDIYVFGTTNPFENNTESHIYKVDINTGNHIRVLDSAVDNFKLINNRLYYVKSQDKFLYSSNLDGTDEKKISKNIVSESNTWYDELNGNVYYIISDGYKCNVRVVNENGEDRLLLKEKVENAEVVNEKLVVKLLNGGDYGMKIFDFNGQLSLTITDYIYNFFAYSDDIIVVLEKDKSVKILQ